jgi:ParB family chromosome partitioning protein
MTDTNTPDTETPSGSGHPESGTLEHIDPRELVLDTNVRDEADLDAQFIASIKEHGVLIPIAAICTDDVDYSSHLDVRLDVSGHRK